jgi:eukaryotic-like serine/threonine-protein kinase
MRPFRSSRAGKLHRDIKPSNVLVTRDGRVVILDFGLIAEQSPRDAWLSDRLAGTPAYMSPEQALARVASEASDWYAVGVTLYETLTGRVPFRGAFAQIVEPKTTMDPPTPAEVSPGVPADLSAVCMGLLDRDPLQRLSGGDALKQLGHSRHTVVEPWNRRDAPFIGRQWQLAVLQESFDESRRGSSAAVCVCGESGMGKSALVRCFLDRLLTREPVIVLSGRCYENESVPYKALDGSLTA